MDKYIQFLRFQKEGEHLSTMCAADKTKSNGLILQEKTLDIIEASFMDIRIEKLRDRLLGKLE